MTKLYNDAEHKTRVQPWTKLPPWRQAMYEAMGPCSECGAYDWWLNDVPLTGFCWGTEGSEHGEVRCAVPRRYQRGLI